MSETVVKAATVPGVTMGVAVIKRSHKTTAYFVAHYNTTGYSAFKYICTDGPFATEQVARDAANREWSELRNLSVESQEC